MARDRGRVQDAFSDYDIVPVSGAAAAVKAKRWTWAVVAGMVAGCLALLWLLIGAVTGGGDEAPVVSASGSGRSAGMAGAALDAWLEGRPMPDGSTSCITSDAVPFDRVDSVSWQRMTQPSADDEMHVFVIDADGRSFSAGVTVHTFFPDPSEIGASSWQAVVGCPTVVLSDVRTPGALEERWAGWVPTTLEGKFLTQAEAWADAYFGTSPDMLYRVTGDSDPTNQYQPLGDQWKVQDVSLDAGAADPVRGEALAAVTVTTDRGVFSFDLLFANIDVALPPVVGWGPTNSGVSLVPFINAVQATVDPSVETGRLTEQLVMPTGTSTTTAPAGSTPAEGTTADAASSTTVAAETDATNTTAGGGQPATTAAPEQDVAANPPADQNPRNTTTTTTLPPTTTAAPAPQQPATTVVEGAANDG